MDQRTYTQFSPRAQRASATPPFGLSLRRRDRLPAAETVENGEEEWQAGTEEETQLY